MQRRNWINSTAVTLLALGGLTMVAHAGGGAQVQLPLKGDVAAPSAQGQVLFQDNGGGQRQLQIEVKGAAEAAGQTVHIRFIDRAKETAAERENESEKETENEKAAENEVGTITLDAKGQGKIRLETKNGDKVPLSVSGKDMKLRLASGRAAAGASFN